MISVARTMHYNSTKINFMGCKMKIVKYHKKVNEVLGYIFNEAIVNYADLPKVSDVAAALECPVLQYEIWGIRIYQRYDGFWVIRWKSNIN